MDPSSRHPRRIPPFRVLQVVGWLAFGVAMALSRIGQFPLDYMVVSKGVLALLGLIVSTGLWWLYRRFLRHGADLWRVVPLSVVASYAASILWTAAHNLFATAHSAHYFDRPARIESAAQLLSGTVYHAFALLAWSLLYFGIKYYEALQAERERSLRAEALAHEARLQALRYQLNPHFLFNTLNAISTLVVDERNREAASMISRLSEFLRLTLEGTDAQEVPLGEEIEFVRRYLEIEQIRFGERLATRIEVEPDALSAPVPAMILQPIIENAIRHGIAPRKKGGSVAIRGYRQGGFLRLHVADNGPGFGGGAPGGHGIGITNTRARLAQLYGSEAGLSLEPLEGGGMEVVLTLPLRHEPAPGRAPAVAGMA